MRVFVFVSVEILESFANFCGLIYENSFQCICDFGGDNLCPDQNFQKSNQVRQMMMDALARILKSQLCSCFQKQI